MLDLPNELWLHTFSYLRLRLDLHEFPRQPYPRYIVQCATLASIARVCKRFNAMAVPLLYHTLPVPFHSSMSDPLARTLSTSPRLAQLVQEADIRTQDGLNKALRQALEAGSWTQSTHITNFLQKCLDGKGVGNAEAHLALFLCMLPNLRVAELEIDIGAELMLDFVTWPENLLSRIMELRLSKNAVRSWMNIKGIDYLMQLPSLRSLYGAEIRWYQYQGPPLDLQHLFLLNSYLDSSSFDNILSCCVSLETLQIHWAPLLRHIELSYHDFSRMGDTLRDFGTNLEKLDLDPYLGPFCAEDSSGRLDSLRSLTRLKQLKLPREMLVGRVKGDTNSEEVQSDDVALQEGNPRLIELLPHGLEHLHLYSCQKDLEALDGEILELLESEQFPRLRCIRVDRDNSFSKDLSNLSWTAEDDEHGIALRKKGDLGAGIPHRFGPRTWVLPSLN